MIEVSNVSRDFRIVSKVNLTFSDIGTILYDLELCCDSIGKDGLDCVFTLGVFCNKIVQKFTLISANSVCSILAVNTDNSTVQCLQICKLGIYSIIQSHQGSTVHINEFFSIYNRIKIR